MSQAMDVSAFARVDSGTEIKFLTCRNGDTEFTFDKADLVIDASETGLRKLAEVVNAAVRDREAKALRSAPGR
jgi:hypothetical protein